MIEADVVSGAVEIRVSTGAIDMLLVTGEGTALGIGVAVVGVNFEVG